MNAPLPLPPKWHAAERGNGFEVPVFNRAGQTIGFRQSLSMVCALNARFARPVQIEVRPFLQPISDEAEVNLQILLMRAGVFRDGRPDWAWAPLEQAYAHFGIGSGNRRWAYLEETIATVLPVEFTGVTLSGRILYRDGLRVSAYGIAYEIRDRFRYVAFRAGDRYGHVSEGAGWTRATALADARRRCDRRLDATIATPGLMRALAEHGFGSLEICVAGNLAMLPEEIREYEDEYWDYQGERLGWW